MATTLGAAVAFGFTGTDGIAATALTGKILLQSVELETTADEEQVRSAVGELVNRTFYNIGDKAALEFIATGATIAAARTNTALQAPGTIISITACADIPALVKTNWIVLPGAKVSGSNTSAKRMTLAIEAHAGITAAATAS